MVRTHPLGGRSVPGMVVANVVVVVLLVLVCVASGAADLTRQPQVVATVTRVGFPEHLVPGLGAIKLIGAAGLLVGLGVTVVGVAAAGGLTAYFVAAMAAHVRVGDPPAQVATPLIPLLLSVAAVVTFLAR